MDHRFTPPPLCGCCRYSRLGIVSKVNPWEYHNQMNASVRQAPSSQYEEREAVSQLSVCDFSSRAFAGAFKLARDRWSHIPISASTDVADDIDTRTLLQLKRIGAKRSHFSAAAFSLRTLPSGLILWSLHNMRVNHQNIAEKRRDLQRQWW